MVHHGIPREEAALTSRDLTHDGHDLLFPRPAPPRFRAHNEKPNILLWLPAAALMCAVLLAPALWNGFPIIFADTGGYLARPFDGTLELGRSALYGAFVAAGLPLDLWLAVIVQSALSVWVIALVIRAQGLGARPLLSLLLVLGLGVLTSLPWYVSQLMPDVFVSLAVLGLYLLTFRRAALRNWEAFLLGGLVAFAAASHMGTLGLCAALVLVLALAWPLRNPLRLPPMTLAGPALAVVGGILLSLGSNALIAGKFAFTPGGTNFVFGRLVQDGIVARYLAEHCPDPSIRLCPYAGELPTTADDWAWGWDSPFGKLGGWQGYEAEPRRIIGETLTLYPGQHVATALQSALQQFASVKTGEGLSPDNNEFAEQDIARLAPAVMPRFRAARQQNDRLGVGWLNTIHVPLALFASFALVIVALGVAARRERSRLRFGAHRAACAFPQRVHHGRVVEPQSALPKPRRVACTVCAGARGALSLRAPTRGARRGVRLGARPLATAPPPRFRSGARARPQDRSRWGPAAR